ncbi:MAG: heavy metal sensor histidine kinase [Burkholderiales bacterium]
MTRRSITLRLSAFFALISLLILISVGWHLYRALVVHFGQRDVSELAGKVELVRHMLSEIKNEADIPADVHRFRDAMVGHDTMHLWLFSNDGSTIFGTSDFEIPADVMPLPTVANALPHSATDWFPVPGRLLRVVSAWGTVGVDLAQQVRIVLVLDASDHIALLAYYRKTIMIALTGALITSILLGAWVTRRELRPVAAIAEAAGAISASRLRDRLGTDKLPDEVRPLVKAFNAMLARLDNSFTRLSDFSSDLAHELRTPVGNLVMHTQVTLSKARSTADYHQALESNLEEFDRLTRIISDMLFLAKADHDQSTLKLETLNLRSEVEAVIEFFDSLAQERKVKLFVDGAGEIAGDRLMVQRAMANLLSNAIRHTAPENTVWIEIAGASPSVKQVSVSNPGPDIPPEHLARLFDRFYRADPARESSSESSGLGLAIVKSIMDLHGGTVDVHSHQGVTRFTLCFKS